LGEGIEVPGIVVGSVHSGTLLEHPRTKGVSEICFPKRISTSYELSFRRFPRRVVWQDALTSGGYATTFLGKYDLAPEKLEDAFRLRMTDHLEREPLSVRSADPAGIGELSEAVRRTVDNADETIDEIIEHINHACQEPGTEPQRFRADRGALLGAVGFHRMQAA
jgi:hypothetical protein